MAPDYPSNIIRTNGDPLRTPSRVNPTVGAPSGRVGSDFPRDARPPRWLSRRNNTIITQLGRVTACSMVVRSEIIYGGKRDHIIIATKLSGGLTVIKRKDNCRKMCFNTNYKVNEHVNLNI